ncbi:MAG: UPF0102 protein [Herpetosiphonaceae bacterium]|nr:MAG: UPF0102 protein [Herpetosiphonaceae bacterium]
MVDHRQKLGALGETLAANYLQSKGLILVERRWRCRYGEIDLVMLDGAALVIVEVRTRRGTDRGSPEESLTPQKRRRLMLVASIYLQGRALAGSPWSGPWRLDVVAVVLDRSGRLARISHIEWAVEE